MIKDINKQNIYTSQLHYILLFFYKLNYETDPTDDCVSCFFWTADSLTTVITQKSVGASLCPYKSL